MSGVIGTAKWMAARAGQGKSEAKAAAAQANGAKGGRPREVAGHERLHHYSHPTESYANKSSRLALKLDAISGC